ncbi:MAG: hypothetical protein AB7G93_17475 [Bdellovibrionales bacterium]
MHRYNNFVYGPALFVLISFGGILPAGLAFADPAGESTNKAYWLCKSRRDVRTIRVHVDKEGTCKTIYSKGGAQKVVGSGKNLQSCMGFLENVKGNLEKSNWSCRDISSTQITDVVE